MNTERLIDTLAQELAPAGPLYKPWIRSTSWLLGAVVYLGVLTLIMASPAEVAANARVWPTAFHHVAAIVTAATAAGAAFASTVPGFPYRRILLLPALALLVWFGSVLSGAVQEWSRGGVSLGAPGEWTCVSMIVLGGALPGVGMLIMLRRGAPLTPALTAGMGMLAVASLASVSACLSHPHPSDAITLVWHGTTILALVVLAIRRSRAVLTWNTRSFA
jgi:hypothetical protein